MALQLRGVDSFGSHHGHFDGSRWEVRDTSLVKGGATGENGMPGDNSLGRGRRRGREKGCSCKVEVLSHRKSSFAGDSVVR
jgi:hypothetical protein